MAETDMSGALSAEDRKLATLARATRARIGAAEGAAVRDTDGRTYAAASVTLASLTVSALKVAVAMAISSGSSGLEAGVVVTETGLVEDDVAVVREFGGAGVVLHVGDARGRVTATTHS